VEFAGLASPTRGSADVCTWRITVEAGLRSPEPHSINRDEIFMVVAGAIQLGPDEPVLVAGDAVVAPAGSPIQLINPGSEPAVAHVVVRSDFTGTLADGTPIGTPPWAC
jgi:mannose-6-phosphate isomerase-like protein (cupin superfamily)